MTVHGVRAVLGDILPLAVSMLTFSPLALVNPLHPADGRHWRSGDIFPDLRGGKRRHRVGSKLLDLGMAGACS